MAGNLETDYRLRKAALSDRIPLSEQKADSIDISNKKQEFIRKAEYGDIGRISEIYIFTKRMTYRTIFQDDMVSFHEMQVLKTAMEFQTEPKRLKNILVYDDGIIKGIMNRGESREKDLPDAFELYELYVDPFFQRQGIGECLIRTFLAEAAAMSKKTLILWVVEENIQARKFYENFLFAPDGKKQLVDGTEKFILRYRRELQQETQKK